MSQVQINDKDGVVGDNVDFATKAISIVLKLKMKNRFNLKKLTFNRTEDKKGAVSFVAIIEQKETLSDIHGVIFLSELLELSRDNAINDEVVKGNVVVELGTLERVLH